jgi:hypothetical protein
VADERIAENKIDLSLSLPLPLCFDVKEIVKRKIVKREEKLDRNFIWFE